MHPTVLLMGALLAGGPRPTAPVAAHSPRATTTSSSSSAATSSGASKAASVTVAAPEWRLVLDERAGRRLELVRTAPAETTPPLEGTLELVEADGQRRRLAERVGAAVLTPDGAVLAVRQGALVRLEGGRMTRTLVASGLSPQLAIDPSGARVALVRSRQEGGSAIDVLELSGDGRPRAVVVGGGYNDLPTFAPDGKTLLFVSTRTGLSSLFRIGLDGDGERQLTNRGAKAVGPLFVPPPERTSPRRLEDGRYTWTSGGQRWFVDLATGQAGRAGEGSRR